MRACINKPTCNSLLHGNGVLKPRSCAARRGVARAATPSQDTSGLHRIVAFAERAMGNTGEPERT